MWQEIVSNLFPDPDCALDVLADMALEIGTMLAMIAWLARVLFDRVD